MQLLMVVWAPRSVRSLGRRGMVSRFPCPCPHRQPSSAWACRLRIGRPAGAQRWPCHFLRRYRCYSLLGFLERAARGPKVVRELSPCRGLEGHLQRADRLLHWRLCRLVVLSGRLLGRLSSILCLCECLPAVRPIVVSASHSGAAQGGLSQRLCPDVLCRRLRAVFHQAPCQA